MHNLNPKWYLYWLVCSCLGLLSGFGYLHLTNVEAVISTPPVSLTSSTIQVMESSSPASVTILLVGDVMLGRSVNKNIVSRSDPTWPFHNVFTQMVEADITFINLESPLVEGCPIVDSGMLFCGDLDNVKGLVYAGVDIASLANNHATNYGYIGLHSTIDALNQHEILPSGLGSPVKVARLGQIFTFLSLNDIGKYPGIDNVDPDTLSDKIINAKSEGEVLVVTFHWGNEYQATPSARQTMLAHLAIGSGADLVIGTHPHWVQTKEIYQGKPIYYSLGNFVFDQEWSMETKQGLAVKATYVDGRLLLLEELPIHIKNYGQPSWQ